MFKPHWNIADIHLPDPADEVQDQGMFSDSGKTKVYLCLPYEGDPGAYANKAYDIFREASNGKRYVLAPYLVVNTVSVVGTRFSEEVAGRLAGELIKECDEFWVTKDVLSQNVLEELCTAVMLKKKICYLVSDEEEAADE